MIMKNQLIISSGEAIDIINEILLVAKGFGLFFERITDGICCGLGICSSLLSFIWFSSN